MTAIPSIDELWKKEECPLVDGVIFNDGTIIEFSVTNKLTGGLIFDVKRKTDLKEILQNTPDNYKCLYHSSLEKIHESNRYMAGEGSWGGDGYITCLDLKTNDVLWIFTSDKINPIIDLDFTNGRVIAKNNNNSVFSIEVKYLDKKVIITEEIENDTTTTAKKS